MGKQSARKSKAQRVGTFEIPTWLIGAGLAIVTLAIYAQVIGHQFIALDDDLYIKENPMVNRGITLARLSWAFTTFYQANWHPLTWISHMIDSQLFGMNAGGHLLVNALIHVANMLLVFWFLLRTTHARWPSALVAALFALHPLQVESVAWAAERKDTLSTFFGLLSLIAYTRYAKAPSRRWYAWTAIALVLGLMAKPVLVTWPFVMLLLDYWPLDRFRHQTSEVGGQKANGTGQPARRNDGGGGWSVVRLPAGALAKAGDIVREKIPLFAIAAASCVVTWIAQAHGGAVRTFTDVPIGLRLSNALVSYAKYILLTFWPKDLAVYYTFAPEGIPMWQIIGAVVLLSAITAFCVFQWKTRPYLIVGWLWFMGTLVPVIGLVQVGGQTMADRYFYIPSIGLFIALVFGLADIAKMRRIAPLLNAGIISVVLLVLAALTNAQIHRWRDSVTLFQYTLAVTPPNLPIEYNLGHVVGEQGKYDEAAAHFEKALQIKPDFFDALLNMGVTRARQGRTGEAVEYYQRAIRVQPNSAKAHAELGVALAKQNRNDAALQELSQALELAPNDADIHTNLGLVFARLGRVQEALDELHQAVWFKPDSAEAHNNLGLVLLASGKARESVPEFQAALRLNPELKVAADNLRRAQAQLNLQP
jgi:protein O-mannosyl-transferase